MAGIAVAAKVQSVHYSLQLFFLRVPIVPIFSSHTHVCKINICKIITCVFCLIFITHFSVGVRS